MLGTARSKPATPHFSSGRAFTIGAGLFLLGIWGAIWELVAVERRAGACCRRDDLLSPGFGRQSRALPGLCAVSIARIIQISGSVAVWNGDFGSGLVTEVIALCQRLGGRVCYGREVGLDVGAERENRRVARSGRQVTPSFSDTGRHCLSGDCGGNVHYCRSPGCHRSPVAPSCSKRSGTTDWF